jgi:hypothetical protein
MRANFSRRHSFWLRSPHPHLSCTPYQKQRCAPPAHRYSVRMCVVHTQRFLQACHRFNKPGIADCVTCPVRCSCQCSLESQRRGRRSIGGHFGYHRRDVPFPMCAEPLENSGKGQSLLLRSPPEGKTASGNAKSSFPSITCPCNREVFLAHYSAARGVEGKSQRSDLQSLWGPFSWQAHYKERYAEVLC